MMELIEQPVIASEVSPQEVDKALECILFCSLQPLSAKQMASMLADRAPLKAVQASLDRLTHKFHSESSGLVLFKHTHGYQLRTKPECAIYLEEFFKKRPWKISRQAMEVLSIIAYKQPIHRAAVDEIRGIESGHLIHTLMDRGLVKMEGRAEDLPGKPLCYGTTPKFLEVFSMVSLTDLPSLAETEQEFQAQS
jgi:segregation and condensation protein B